MSAPLVVNTKDGAVWTRRAVTVDGTALYALASRCSCPEFVMATLADVAEHGIVGSANVLPVPVGPKPRALDAERRAAAIAELIGDAKPATDHLLLEMAQQIRDRREHDHSSAADWDWYCLNASGWLGDKAPTVLRRLLDAEARVAELEAQAELLAGALVERPEDPTPAEGDGITRRIAPTQALREDATAEGPIARLRQTALHDLPRGARWRVIVTDSESPTGVAPVCTTDGALHQITDYPGGPKYHDEGVYDCCPWPQFETNSQSVATYLVALLNADAEAGDAS